MTPRCADQPYASHLDFYRDVYGHAIVDARCAGSVGATLFTTEQEAVTGRTRPRRISSSR
jgi:hypothetical protein